MRPAAKTKPAGTALAVERNFLVVTYVASGNGECEDLDHPAIRDCQPSISPVVFSDPFRYRAESRAFLETPTVEANLITALERNSMLARSVSS
jgi:hypothetical protein